MTNFDVDDPRYRITPTQQMLCSCIGALATSSMMTPLDVVKIRLQAQQKMMPSKHCFIYCNGLMDHCIICVNGNGNKTSSTLTKEQWYKRPGHFNGTLDAMVKIVKTEGASSLWSGLSPTLVLAIPATVIYFTTYEQMRQIIQDRKTKGGILSDQPVWLTSLAAGALARVWAVSLVSPLELIRTKMQSKRLSYQEIGVAIRSLVKSQGVLGLWQGLVPSLLRDVPFSAIYWAIYETYKKFLVPSSNHLTLWQSFVGGSISGTVAAIVTIPFDVVKTLRQLEFGELQLEADKPVKKASTTREIIQRIYRQRGIGGLFAGLVPRIAKIAPACAIMISSYEYGKFYFSRRNKSLVSEP